MSPISSGNCSAQIIPPPPFNRRRAGGGNTGIVIAPDEDESPAPRMVDVGSSECSCTEGDPGPDEDVDGVLEDVEDAAAAAAAAAANADAPNPGTVSSALANSLDDSGRIWF